MGVLHTEMKRTSKCSEQQSAPLPSDLVSDQTVRWAAEAGELQRLTEHTFVFLQVGFSSKEALPRVMILLI